MSLANLATELSWITYTPQRIFILSTFHTHSVGYIVSAVAPASNPVHHTRTKHIEIYVHFVRDMVLRKDLEIRYVLPHDQIEDCLSKALTSSRFQFLRDKIGVVRFSELKPDFAEFIELSSYGSNGRKPLPMDTLSGLAFITNCNSSPYTRFCPHPRPQSPPFSRSQTVHVLKTSSTPVSESVVENVLEMFFKDREVIGSDDGSGLLKLLATQEWLSGDNSAPRNKKAIAKIEQNPMDKGLYVYEQVLRDDSERRKKLNLLKYEDGSVLRVYIPSSSNKPNYRNHTFAFVLFAKEEGLKKAVANVNGIWIDGKKVSIGVAKYQKQRSRQAASRNSIREEDLLNKGVNWRRRVRNESLCHLRDERSYKDALVSYGGLREVSVSKENRGGLLRKDAGLKNLWEMHIPYDESDWVKSSLTGIIKTHFDLELVLKGLASDGIKVKLAKWSYAWNSCILTFGSVEELKEAWSSIMEELSFWFDRLHSLLNEEGLPMAYCSGKLICIHDSTVRREDMAIARALLRVASPFDIPKTVTLGSYGISFKVKINVGSVCIKHKGFSVENSAVADDGVYRDVASSEEEEDRCSGEVGRSDMLAEDTRGRVDTWLEGDDCTAVAGGNGSQQLMWQVGEGQPSGERVSEFPEEGSNDRLQSQFRGILKKSNEKMLEEIVDLDKEYRSVKETEVDREVIPVQPVSNQVLGFNKESFSNGLKSWSPLDHLSRSLYFRNAPVGRWNRGTCSRVYRRSIERKVWFGGRIKGGVVEHNGGIVILGKLICIHDSTVRTEDMAIARALLRVASPFDIQKTVTLGSYGISFKVKINVGSVCIKHKGFSVENSAVADDGVYRDVASSEEEEDRCSGEVGRSDMLAEDTRGRVDTWLEGDDCTAVAGGNGSQQLMWQVGEGQPSGERVSEFPEEGSNDRLQSQFRGILKKSNEKMLEEIVDLDKEYRSVKETEVDREVIPVQPVSNQVLGFNKESFSNGLNSWSPLDHLSRSLYFRNAPVGRWNRGTCSRVYRRSIERKVWFNPSREEGVLQTMELIDQNTVDQLQISGSVEEFLSGGQSESVAGNESRRKRRFLIREALDVVSCLTISFSSFSMFLEEALATWEVSKILGISFKEGKKASLENIIKLEEGLAEKEEGFEDLVKSSLDDLRGRKKRSDIFSILQGTKKSIRNLSGRKLYGISESISELEMKINDLEFKAQCGNLSHQEWDQMMQFRSNLWRLYRIEESIWFQKSRTRLIKDGDKNTRFFHLSALNRSKRNEISSLKINGYVVSDPHSIKLHISNFFKTTYNSKSTMEVEDLLLDFAKLSGDQSSKLEEHFFEQKIWQAIASSDSSKAPGPNGFTMGFFKRCWPSLKEFVMIFFKDLCFGRKWEHGVNHAFITLIPKKLNLDSVEDFRPISLVGSLYKIISKVLSKRLSCCVGDIISQSQFAFIPRRQLLDCAFIANEGIDYWRKQMLEGVVLKVDFHRAYDSVEWPILFRAMSEMGFGNRWSSWILQCLSSASISVLVNGSPSEEFPMAKGLRQGCSLSPLLFNIVGELLHLMLSKAVDMGLFQGFIIGKSENSVRLSHLQVHLNLVKSKLFGINVDDAVLTNWALAVGCSVGSFPTNYLGLPLDHFRSCKWAMESPFLFRLMLRSALGNMSGGSDLWLKGVWLGLSPPRVETFPWQLAHQKVAVRAELVKRGLSIVLPQDPHSLVSSWGKLRVNSLIWKFILGVVFWSIWKVRNAIVFEGSPLDRLSLFFIVRFRLSKWFLAKFPKFPIQEDILIGDPSLADGISVPKSKDCPVIRWLPPVDVLKMYVDGAIKLDGSDGGIGGILRDWNSCTLLTFSENVGQGPPPVAELKAKAIKRGIEIFLSSRWVSVGRLIVESDCKSAVEWIQSPSLAPIFFSPLVKQISTLISERVQSVRLIPRACNGEADSLAKKGIG
ncbi:hypothetical protein F3Y22_tig00003715pilonHSYRG00041 [Hibiscus syriacus]|uniref:Reverse transcriptase domain-containing protein n=1 Tax=Hibiscus syriacus TaxID=106335 RepID=A0A6A3CKY5_HIBSY|nr:hypothetical protein F3Y22_tig00003715pilonHSYRG00041 [Hibiscus syriacus]